MPKATIHIKGNDHTWVINWNTTQEQMDDMNEDGLEVMELVYSIPMWVVNAGLGRVWCFFEDIFNFRNPWGRR